MTEKQQAMYMFLTLSAEARKYSYILKGVLHQEAKNVLNHLHNAENRFIKVIERELGYDFLEELENQSEIFSMVLKKVLELDTDEKKEELFNLLSAYANNEITIIN